MKRGNTVGNNIRRVRLRRGFTQEQLGLESGLSQGYINQLESGKRRYTQKTLEQIVYSISIRNLRFLNIIPSNDLQV
jgi:transcriptional regulator with XRE-family HTH domain